MTDTIPFDIKKAHSRDFREIAEIYAGEFSKPPFNEPWTLQKAEHRIHLYATYCDIFKIIVADTITGFAVFNPHHWCPGEVVFGEEMAMCPEFQNKGRGTNVLKHLLSYYKKRGYKKCMGIANKKGRALNLYARLGFKTSQENVVIEKDL